MVLVLEWILWCSAGAVVLTAIGYPLFLGIVGPLVRRKPLRGTDEPTVTLIIAAYNEEAVIEKKLLNSLALDYPREKLEIIVASDGSTDRTHELVERYRNDGILLKSFARSGKTGVQNRVARLARGDILIFSDANAMYRNDAVRKLVSNFADQMVGGVCGQLVYTVEEPTGAGKSENLYWNYEKFMKQQESNLSSVVGANGSIYAVRRADYVEIDEDMISDFVEPLAIVRNGKRVVYEPEAISVELASTNYAAEFRRKVRILTRSILGLLRMRDLMNPLRFGMFAIQLIMHKLLRFITPSFLIVGFLAFAALAALAITPYRMLFVITVPVGVAALLVTRFGYLVKPGFFLKLSHMIYYYSMANYALVLAWLNVLRGRRITLWAPERTDR